MSSMSSSGDDTNDEADVFCSVCLVPLNHDLYDVKAIPSLLVPACIICFDELRRKRAFGVKKVPRLTNGEDFPEFELYKPGNEDMCSWCRRDDQGTLFLCSNDGTCPHQFCESCVSSNLGEGMVESINGDNDWQCFVCDSSPLNKLRNTCRDAQEKSCYHILATTEDDEEKAKIMFHILEDIVEEVNTRSLECDEFINKCGLEIGPELKFSEKRDELQRLRELWEQHFTILEMQNSILSDALNDMGYSGEVSELHKAYIQKQSSSSMYSHEKFHRLNALDTLNQIPLFEDNRSIRKEALMNEELNLSSDYESDEEDDTAENDEMLKTLENKAENDEIVQSFSDEADLNLLQYPREFSRKVPTNVLKALYYAFSEEDKEHLVNTFRVPRHIAIVMNYASEEFPANTKQWSIHRKLHPKVLQAMYYAKTPPEMAILGNRYNLSAELTDVVDFEEDYGDSDFSVQGEEARKISPNKHRRRSINLKMEKLAYAEENRQDQEYIQRVKKSVLKDMKSKKLRRRSKDLLKRMNRLNVKVNKVSTNTQNILMDVDSDNDDEEECDNDKEVEDENDVCEYSRIRKQAVSISRGNDRDVDTNNDLESANDGNDESDNSFVNEEEEENSDEDEDDIIMAALPMVAHKIRAKQTRQKQQRQKRKSKEKVASVVIKKENTISQAFNIQENKNDKTLIGTLEKKQTKLKVKSMDKSEKDDFLIDLTLDDDEDEVVDSDDISIDITSSNKQPRSSFPIFNRQTNQDSAQKKAKTSTIQLSEESLSAREVEKKRKQEMLAFKHFPSEGGLVINEKRPEQDPPITMVDHFVKLLRPHQIEGIRFLWENTMKSITAAKQINEKETYGSILAHCMGLGKTFTVISFLVTLMANPIIRSINDPDPTLQTDDAGGFSIERPKPLLHRVLIITPKNVLHNWAKEVHKWTPHELIPLLNVITIDSTVSSQSKNGKSQISRRLQKIHDWYMKGGILVMSYDMFRNMVTEDIKDSRLSANDQKLRLEKAQKYLLNPGPDLVVADEAHIIKNNKSKINEAVSALRTKRRIALTGTPLQNHLEEYWCMVEWVKKRFLYSRKEFQKLFIQPIKAGEAKEAHPEQVRKMKKRSHALYSKLSTIVHRKDQSELAKTINKREFIITTRITDFQKYLYKLYLSKLQGGTGSVRLFRCFQTLMRLSNHPVNIVMHSQVWKEIEKKGGGGTASAIASKYATTRIPLKEMSRQLKPVYDHFKNQGKEAMEKLEKAAEMQEQSLLRDPVHKRTPTKKNKKFKKKQKKHKKMKRKVTLDLDDIPDNGEDSDYFKENEDNSDNNDDNDEESSDSEQNEENDDSVSGGFASDEDEYDVQSDEKDGNYDDDDDDDILDFIEDDDVVEYEDDVINKKKKRKLVIEINENSNNNEDHDEEEIIIVRKSASSKRIRLSNSFHSLLSDNEECEEVVENDVDDNADKEREEGCSPDEDAMNEDTTKVPTITPAAKTGTSATDTKSSNAVINTSNTENNNSNVCGAVEKKLSVIDDGAENELTEDETPDELGPHWWKIKATETADGLGEALTAKELLYLSNKMVTVLALLALTVQGGEKMIIFSQSLYTLDAIEKFLMLPKWGDMVRPFSPIDENDNLVQLSYWAKGNEYLRIDGSINNRQVLIDKFNDPKSGRHCHLMLISTKAGNMGINLQAANRLVLFDCSWNPMHDLQAIYRAYRVGQDKDVFIYRMVSGGTMEEKIYKKQVAKMARANRVVDAQMPNNAFTEKEKSELLRFDDDDEKDDYDMFDTSDDEEGEEEANGNVDTGNGEGEGEEAAREDSMKMDVVVAEAKAKRHPIKRISQAQKRLMQALQGGTQDRVLSQFLTDFGTSFFTSIENHDSFLEDNTEAHLNSEEKESAELELQQELSLLRGDFSQLNNTNPNQNFARAPSAYAHLKPANNAPPESVTTASTKNNSNITSSNTNNNSNKKAATSTSKAPMPFSEQEDQIIIAARTMFVTDPYFTRIAPAMNTLFNRTNVATMRTSTDFRLRYEELYNSGRAEVYFQDPNFKKFREEVREVFRKRGIVPS